MKLSIIISFIAVVVLITACSKTNSQLKEGYLPVTKCQAFNVGGGTLTVCLDSVLNDSRCPSNSICVWQGLATARFSVRENNKAHTITLATRNFGFYRRDTIVEGFRIEFINLGPQRKDETPVNYNDYIAELKVTKQ